jgi:putative transcriptional regulator
VKSRLRNFRRERNWTQEQLGDLIGVSRQAINAVETERHAPSLDLGHRIAAAFQLPIEDIFPNPYHQYSAPHSWKD